MRVFSGSPEYPTAGRLVFKRSPSPTPNSVFSRRVRNFRTPAMRPSNPYSMEVANNCCFKSGVTLHIYLHRDQAAIALSFLLPDFNHKRLGYPELISDKRVTRAKKG